MGATPRRPAAPRPRAHLHAPRHDPSLLHTPSPRWAAVSGRAAHGARVRARAAPPLSLGAPSRRRAAWRRARRAARARGARRRGARRAATAARRRLRVPSPRPWRARGQTPTGYLPAQRQELMWIWIISVFVPHTRAAHTRSRRAAQRGLAAPSRISSATIERPAPIARQGACGVQRRKSAAAMRQTQETKAVGSYSLQPPLLAHLYQQGTHACRCTWCAKRQQPRP